MPFCPNCREEVDTGQKFCYKCGYDLSRFVSPHAETPSGHSDADVLQTRDEEVYSYDAETPNPRPTSAQLEEYRAYSTRESPSALWWFLPLFFSVLGGIIGYVALREDDDEMALGILISGILLFVFLLGILGLFGFVVWEWVSGIVIVGGIVAIVGSWSAR